MIALRDRLGGWEHTNERNGPERHCTARGLQVLKVAAYTNGRPTVSLFDCLLLQHVCWHRPGDRAAIESWLLDQIVKQADLKQMEFLLLGVFARACKAMNNRGAEQGSGSGSGSGGGGEAGVEDAKGDLAALLELLADKAAELGQQRTQAATLVGADLWLEAGEAAALEARLGKPLAASQANVRQLMRDALTLEACLGGEGDGGKEAVPLHIVADLLPSYWADFIRKGDIDDVRPLGVRPQAQT